MNKLVTLLASLVLLAGCHSAERLTSPDGRTEVLFSLSESGEPTYELDFRGEKLILPSRLGIVTSRGALTEGFTLEKTEYI